MKNGRIELDFKTDERRSIVLWVDDGLEVS